MQRRISQKYVVRPRFVLFLAGIEEHYKYRADVMNTYPYAHYPVFDGYNHMQYQIKDPQGFAGMLVSIIEKNEMPELSFLKEV